MLINIVTFAHNCRSLTNCGRVAPLGEHYSYSRYLALILLFSCFILVVSPFFIFHKTILALVASELRVDCVINAIP